MLCVNTKEANHEIKTKRYTSSLVSDIDVEKTFDVEEFL